MEHNGRNVAAQNGTKNAAEIELGSSDEDDDSDNDTIQQAEVPAAVFGGLRTN